MVNKTKISWTIEQGAAVGPQVYQILRRGIIHGQLDPGTRLSETEVSRSLETSRQPVREAFIKLSDEGLVVVRPQRGTIVTKISTKAVENARFIREAIEADIVKLLAQKHDPEVVAELHHLVTLQRQVPPDEQQEQAFKELDDRFHKTLADAAGKSRAWDVIEGLKAHMDRVRCISFQKYPFKKLIRQHAAVVDAIADGDLVQAESAIRQHLQEILLDMPQIVAEKQELFEE